MQAAQSLPAQISLRIIENDNAILGVVGVVGAGVVFESVDGVEAQRAHGTPAQVAEVDEQIGSDVAHLPVQLLRLERHRAQQVALVIGGGLEAADHLLAEGLNLPRRDDAVGLPPCHVEEDTGVVAAGTPHLGLLPVHLALFQRHQARRLILEHQQPLLLQPLVDAETTFQRFSSVI